MSRLFGARSATQRSGWRATLVAVALALLLLVAGLAKPVHMDDTYFLFLARHIADSPADPFGFEIFWSVWPDRASENYVPPVLPYYYAAAIAVAGESQLALKLSLFPLMLMFVLALRTLLAQVAERDDPGALMLVALAPCLLVSWNLMLDLPSLGFGIAAVAVFMTYSAHSRWIAPVAVGVLLAAAAQTKYSGLIYPVVIVWWAMLHGTWRAALLSLLTAAAFFCAWELYLWAQYGQSQFVWAVAGDLHRSGWGSRGLIVRSMLVNFGALVAPAALIMLGWSRLASRWSMPLLGAGLLVVIGVFCGIGAGLPVRALTWLAVGASGACAAALLLLFREGLRPPTGACLIAMQFGRIEAFLLGWFLLEVAFAFAITPFGAARRVIGVTLVALLVLLRVARHGSDGRSWRRAQLVALIATILVSLGLQLTDIEEARAQRDSVASSGQRIRALDPSARIWYVGHWGFAYYADRLSMMPIVPGESRLEVGDWVLVPDVVDSQSVDFDPERFQETGMIESQSSLPWATVPTFYAGVFPIGRADRTRLRVQLLRVTRAHRAEIGFDLQTLAQYVRQRAAFSSTLRALPDLLTYLDDADPKARALALRTIGLLGSRAQPHLPAIARMQLDSDPDVRNAAVEAQRAIGGS